MAGLVPTYVACCVHASCARATSRELNSHASRLCRQTGASGQRGNPHPEHVSAANGDVVFADEIEFPIATHTEHSEARRNHAPTLLVAHRELPPVGRDETPAARIQGESARVNPPSIGVLDQGRLASILVDRKNGDAIFPSKKKH